MFNAVLLLAVGIVIGSVVTFILVNQFGVKEPKVVAELGISIAHIPAEVRARGLALAQSLETVEAGGEYQRHTWLAQMGKEFPLVAKRDLGKLIEWAVEKL